MQFANNVNTFQDVGECNGESPTPKTPTDKSTALNDKHRRAKIKKTKQHIDKKAKTIYARRSKATKKSYRNWAN